MKPPLPPRRASRAPASRSQKQWKDIGHRYPSARPARPRDAQCHARPRRRDARAAAAHARR